MNQWNHYMYNLYQRMEEQDQRIKALESKVERLEQNSKRNSVEKIEYHFDQLKIENLDGTLHIGLSPNDLKAIDDFSVPSANKSWQDQVAADLNNYLQENGENLIHQIAQQQQFSLDEVNPSMLINDMAKQLPDRIAFYEKEAARNQQNLPKEQLHQYIFEQIKKEINHSLYTYMERNDTT